MRTRKIVVLPYDVAWQSAFEKIKDEIEDPFCRATFRFAFSRFLSIKKLGDCI